jgi:PelA/Pel-15E family pectate lyase
MRYSKRLFLALMIFCSFRSGSSLAQNISDAPIAQRELIANNILLHQRSNGGWPKHIQEKKVDYTKTYTPAEIAVIKENFASGKDATIDNNATIQETRFLASEYTRTRKQEYLGAVERGIAYLLKAQYSNGGWPQFYPDNSGYRHYITYNDNAMINVLNLLEDVAVRKDDFAVVSGQLSEKASDAVKKGIDCILKTQIKVNGKLTVWCAQHDDKTLQPANARAFELKSLSGMESASIVQFLMKQKNPSVEVKHAITKAVEWFERSKIEGYRFEATYDSAKKRTHNLVKDPTSTVWARFYDIDTNEPFFTGRDGIKKKSIYEIEDERRNGYAWYGAWGEKLFKAYPKWAAANLKNPVSTP